MAVSAFRSSSRRPNLISSSKKTTPTTSSDKETKKDPPKKVPPRRSRSVSAFSRTQLEVSSSTDFLIKRDNPLFSTSSSPPPQEDITGLKLDEISSAKSKAASAEHNITSRGRSVSRNADSGKPVSGIGRSLSRASTGRSVRSVSQCPGPRRQNVTSESEVEQEDSLSVKARNGKRSGLVKSSSCMLDQMKCLRTPCGQRLGYDSSDGSATKLPCLQTPNWEDGISTCSFSEAEEKTIKAVCEQMQSFQGDNLGGDTSASGIYETVRSEVRRAIADIQNDLESAMRRSNTTAVQKDIVSDIPPDSVNPGAVELVLDIRREYAKKLEQSLERATKLRADLAVEEHRGIELSRILKEVLPDPKTPNVLKSRPGRKTSIEKRKMSKRLTEEAMAYFDECVSLSTFDSSDFSSQEDPPLNLVGAATLAGDRASLSVPASYRPNSCLNDKQEGWFTHSQDALELTASSSTKEHARDQVNLNSTDKIGGRKFSFNCRPSETDEFQKDILKYVRNFEKDLEKANVDPQIVTSKHYDLDEYKQRTSSQSMLFDRVLLKNRLESGSLLLCGGGIAISSSPFASII